MSEAEPPAGFSLIEVVVVLAILAMVGGLVLARGPAHSAAADMRVATGTVAQALRIARSRAIATNRSVPVQFDPAAATLRVGAGPLQALPPRIGFAVASAAILFLPDGSSTGGRVALAGEGRTAQVGVEWLTGRVSVTDAP